ncbi:hypothetical protein K458DRAFT_293025 [Lentithecium fluviatile CBS 122367]|uniref:Uncharacterized protein n=1 Tax=Lentithecium fluviatile CBS 122367 TaxID=1168545 RepID=A0A6G1JEW2_9PLEO|nr:hypothetical protein K458DRAFT_293025 [Lentithecium fluviatile CBS 122367]
MPSFLRLLCIIIAQLWAVNANVEKTVFLGPSPVTLPNVTPSLDDLRLDTLDPAHLAILATKLPVQFPSRSAPRGLESWYLLRGLEDGRRYEVRICWPATQPTDFWLDAYSVAHVFDTPSLISSLADYSDKRQAPEWDELGHSGEEAPPQSILFLRVQAAASYYSSNRTLMEHPLPVDVDIILDPFILNILPHSLGPTAIYISIVSGAAWFLSGYVYCWLLSVANEHPSKAHPD